MKTKRMSANMSTFISKKTIIPTLQVKPVLTRNTAKVCNLSLSWGKRKTYIGQENYLVSQTG